MLFGLLDDDTPMDQDPAKLALFHAMGNISRTGATNLPDVLRSGLQGAGQGYAQYQNNRAQQAGLEAERQKQQLENLYKLAQVRKMQYEMGAADREKTKLEEQRVFENQQRGLFEGQLGELNLPPEQEKILRAMGPDQAKLELREIRNEEITRNRTSKYLQKFIAEKGYGPTMGGMANEIMKYGNNSAESFSAAIKFLDDHKPESAVDLPVDLNLFQQVYKTPWDTTGQVMPLAIDMLRKGSTVKQVTDWIEARRKQTEPEETDNTKISSNGETIQYFNLAANKGTDNLWRGADGKLLPGGGVYRKSADGKGLIWKVNQKNSDTIVSNATGINLITGLAQAISDKAQQLGRMDRVTKINQIMDPSELAGLQAQYIEVLMNLKKVYELGAIQEADLKILNAAVQDPTGWSYDTVGSMLDRLNTIRNSMNANFIRAARANNYDPNELYRSTYSPEAMGTLNVPDITQPAPQAQTRSSGGYQPKTLEMQQFEREKQMMGMQ